MPFSKNYRLFDVSRNDIWKKKESARVCTTVRANFTYFVRFRWSHQFAALHTLGKTDGRTAPMETKTHREMNYSETHETEKKSARKQDDLWSSVAPRAICLNIYVFFVVVVVDSNKSVVVVPTAAVTAAVASHTLTSPPRTDIEMFDFCNKWQRSAKHVFFS